MYEPSFLCQYCLHSCALLESFSCRIPGYRQLAGCKNTDNTDPVASEQLHLLQCLSQPGILHLFSALQITLHFALTWKFRTEIWGYIYWGVGTRSLRSLPTQATLWLYEIWHPVKVQNKSQVHQVGRAMARVGIPIHTSHLPLSEY